MESSKCTRLEGLIYFIKGPILYETDVIAMPCFVSRLVLKLLSVFYHFLDKFCWIKAFE